MRISHLSSSLREPRLPVDDHRQRVRLTLFCGLQHHEALAIEGGVVRVEPHWRYLKQRPRRFPFQLSGFFSHSRHHQLSLEAHIEQFLAVATPARIAPALT